MGVHLLVWTLTHQLLLMATLLLLLLKLLHSLLLMTELPLLRRWLRLEMKWLVVEHLVLLMEPLLLRWQRWRLTLLWERVIDIPILVLVAPHRTAAIAVRSVGLRGLAQGGTVVLSVLLGHTSISHGPRTKERLAYGVMSLHTGVVSHRLSVGSHDLLRESGRGCRSHTSVLP